ncbi:MAG: inositol monophosphatase family protein [Bacillota bacterium]
MKENSDRLKTVADIVITAGKMIRERLGGRFITSFKSCPSDMVTEIDRHSQEIILAGLKKEFPGHHFIAEEEFIGDMPEPGDTPTWIIDPLDGTTNFVFGIPLCTVTVAMTEGGTPSLGVTYDPFREELFTAERGRGAYLNGKSISVDKKRSVVAESLFATGFPSSDSFKEEMWRADFKKMFFKSVDVRAFGSAALELAYIACGRLTGYWEVSLRPWDIAAGMLLVKEAGGRISDPNGRELILGNYNSIVASNGLIHDEFLRDLGFRRA